MRPKYDKKMTEENKDEGKNPKRFKYKETFLAGKQKGAIEFLQVVT